MCELQNRENSENEKEIEKNVKKIQKSGLTF